MFAMFLVAMAGADAAPPPAIDAKIQFFGRWDRRQSDRAITVNGGSYVVARFEGQSIGARFDLSRNKPPVPTIAWRIDDDIQWREAEIAASMELEKDLKPGGHRIQLVIRGLDEHQPRWSEPLTASVTFLGFDLPNDGKLLDAPAEPKLKIEFLGDSITEGVLVHTKQPGRETWPWLTDGLQAWPSQTALRLGAQWRQVGFGAVGVTKSGSGGVPAAPESFDWFYENCPRDDWQPDVVVVNHGTNDGAASAEKFRPAYATYLARIRKAYPHAKILALRPFAGTHVDDIQAEVAAQNSAGDAKVTFVDTTGWLDRADFTDGVHPNAGAGPKVAGKLAKIIAELSTARDSAPGG
jgi:lysophospholipase L1-like esterase